VSESLAECEGLLIISTDGASSGNPGPAGIGGIAKLPDGKVLMEVSEYLGEATNNEAEYYALLRMLERVREYGFKRLVIRTDSELLSHQVRGNYRTKSKKLKGLLEMVMGLLEPYEVVQIEHVGREENKECDYLARMAISKGLKGELEPILRKRVDEALF